MIIDEFVAGILVTIFAELILFAGVVVYFGTKK